MGSEETKEGEGSPFNDSVIFFYSLFCLFKIQKKNDLTTQP